MNVMRMRKPPERVWRPPGCSCCYELFASYRPAATQANRLQNQHQYGFPSKKVLDNFDAVKVKYIFRTDLDGSVMLKADKNGHYDMQTLKSERIVAVPEFDNALALSSLTIAAVIMLKGKMIWRKSR